MDNINDNNTINTLNVLTEYEIIDRDTTSEVLSFDELYSNDAFLNEKNKFTLDLLNSIRNDEPDDFYQSFAYNTFMEYYNKYGIAVGEWMNDILTCNLSNVAIVCGILKILSFTEYNKLQSFARSMLMLCIFQYDKTPDIEVTEQIIKCIENWNDKAFISILNDLKINIAFLDFYRDQVLADLQLN